MSIDSFFLSSLSRSFVGIFHVCDLFIRDLSIVVSWEEKNEDFGNFLACLSCTRGECVTLFEGVEVEGINEGGFW